MPTGPARSRAPLWLVLAIVAGLWGAQTTGIVSSNDGSHVALSRALALRGETSIDPDWRLTMGIDLARRDGRYYSDRPPGTAFLAMPAVWLGHLLDPVFASTSRRSGELVRRPASRGFALTYHDTYPGAPPLGGLQGTALLLALHTVTVGLLGLFAVDRWLHRRGVAMLERRFAVVTLGVASLWGPYATALFSHGSAIALMAGFALGVEALRSRPEPGVSQAATLTGLAGASAIACDYALLLAVPLAVLLLVPRRHWVGVALGALPAAAAVALYHHQAFGGVLRIGYQEHVTFDFAHALGTTFDGSPLDGLWVLWGLGADAGVLARSPILWAGLAALILRPGVGAGAGVGQTAPSASNSSPLGWLLAFAPWLLALSLHRTPWGGGTQDYRYLTPMLPLLGLGLALAWQRWGGRPGGAAALLGLALYSLYAAWVPWLGWHGGPAFGAVDVGLALALAVGATGLVATRAARSAAPTSASG